MDNLLERITASRTRRTASSSMGNAEWARQRIVPGPITPPIALLLRGWWEDFMYYSRNNHPLLILSVGRLVAKKGYDDLLRALAALPPDLHWRFVHIGGGAQAAQTAALAEELGLSDRIDWRGAQPQRGRCRRLFGRDRPRGFRRECRMLGALPVVGAFVGDGGCGGWWRR